MTTRVPLALLATQLLSGSALVGADPEYYCEAPTWHETFLRSVEALDVPRLERGLEPWESPVIQGGEEAKRLELDVSGARRMFLQVTGDPDKVWGVANWGDPVLVDREGVTHALTTAGRQADGKPALEWRVLKGRHAINLNLHSGLYEPMRTGGREFERGIHVQADSLVEVILDGAYVRFETWIGVDDWSKGRGNVRFRVLNERAAAVELLWDLVERDFVQGEPRREMKWERLDGIWSVAWRSFDSAALTQQYLRACQAPALWVDGQAEAVAGEGLQDPLAQARELYLAWHRFRERLDAAKDANYEALRLAIKDLEETFGLQSAATQLRDRLHSVEQTLPRLIQRVSGRQSTREGFDQLNGLMDSLDRLRRDIALANPLLDFDRLLVVKRKPLGDPRRSQWDDRGLGEFLGLPRQSSWGLGTMPVVDDWENEIAVLSLAGDHWRADTLYTSGDRRLITDIDLHWDGRRLLFSMPDESLSWQVHELSLDDRRVRQLTPEGCPDVHNYDSVYLPNDRIAFISTAPLQGVPCNSGVIVGMMYVMDSDGSNIRQVCFEQDHDYTPSVLNNGRVLYLRWDYTDTPHVWNRLLMSMNPDGTGQMEYYGSGSYWPNAIFFARAVPNHPTKIAAIVTGHHEGRVGELVLFDPARGRHEVEGVVQRIPGRGQPVEPVIEDKPTEHSWPKFLHPWPLNESYCLVSCKPHEDALWGIYLVDVFDNMTLLHEEEGVGLFEPIPLRSKPRPPMIPDKVKPELNSATVYIEDIYQGPGLRGVPRGTVKKLRLFTYHFGFQKMAGIDHRVGVDGPWEVKRVLGTVPVWPDGSALFNVPAKTPLSMQPLDAEGQALALMRSWMTAMPGEVVSCVGCHERVGTAPRNRGTQALRVAPVEIEPWHGPVRGFSFAREVQPVLDRYCVGCHDGRSEERGEILVDLRADQGAWWVYRHGNPEMERVRAASKEELVGKYAGVFDPAYIALRKLVRVGGLESDLHPLPPKEFAADTSELVQMLRKGHHGVELNTEAWDRLTTWIDLNAPCQGSWGETYRIPISDQPERRRELRRLYGGLDEDPEDVLAVIDDLKLEPVMPREQERLPKATPVLDGWPVKATDIRHRQVELGRHRRTLDLGEGVRMDLARIPAGRFVMGDADGALDEQPPRIAEIARSFWMGRFEVTNEEFSRFDPDHDSRFEHRSSWIFDEAYLGWPLNRQRQPVVRISWEQAMAFCRWVSEKTGENITLPTEVQWEYACRAGTATSWNYGDESADFSAYANMADQNLRRLAWEGWRPRSPDTVARDERFDDGHLVTAAVGTYAPNPWGLHDLHGNVAEWTASKVASAAAGRTDRDLRVVRGGSWRDRPERCRSSFRLAYAKFQPVFNVGFRVVVEDEASGERLAQTGP